MQNIDYTYRFHSIAEKQNQVEVIIHKTGEKRSFSVAANDSQFSDRPSPCLPSKLADLVDIATAVFTADHMATRRGEMKCSIEIILPVRNPDYYNQPHIVDILKDILYWYTEDIWSFKFVLREGYGRASELQPRLLPGRDAADEVALWSGGLDSLAGVCNRWFNNPSTRFILFGTGGDKTTRGRQLEISSLINDELGGNFTLIRVPLHLRYNGVYKIRDLNKICRSRGFVFLVLGSVCALLEGRDELLVYENGVGAINLNFSGSELGLDHTRSVHPKSLIKVSNFISEVTNSSFTIRNPFMFHTKTQMCKVFQSLSTSVRALIPLTVSCDREQRKPGQRLQCGRCSSCLLRHLALIASGIGDETKYDSYPIQQDIPSSSHYWAMTQQVETMRPLLGKQNAWNHLALEYPETLPELAYELSMWFGSDMAFVQRRIIALYEQHISEWEYLQRESKPTMLPYQNPNFLHKVAH